MYALSPDCRLAFAPHLAGPEVVGERVLFFPLRTGEEESDDDDEGIEFEFPTTGADRIGFTPPILSGSGRGLANIAFSVVLTEKDSLWLLAPLPKTQELDT
jgi:hypothetical protein